MLLDWRVAVMIVVLVVVAVVAGVFLSGYGTCCDLPGR